MYYRCIQGNGFDDYVQRIYYIIIINTYIFYN